MRLFFGSILDYFQYDNHWIYFDRNVDSITFAEFCQKLTDKLRKLDEDKLSGADTLPMKSLLKLDDEKDNLNKSSPSDDTLKPPRDDDDPDRLGFDGNYLKPKIESDIWQQFEDDERKRNNGIIHSSPTQPPHETQSRSRNSLSLFQDALSISPPPEEVDITDAIKTVLNKNNDWCVALFVYF